MPENKQCNGHIIQIENPTNSNNRPHISALKDSLKFNITFTTAEKPHQTNCSIWSFLQTHNRIFAIIPAHTLYPEECKHKLKLKVTVQKLAVSFYGNAISLLNSQEGIDIAVIETPKTVFLHHSVQKALVLDGNDKPIWLSTDDEIILNQEVEITHFVNNGLNKGKIISTSFQSDVEGFTFKNVLLIESSTPKGLATQDHNGCIVGQLSAQNCTIKVDGIIVGQLNNVEVNDKIIPLAYLAVKLGHNMKQIQNELVEIPTPLASDSDPLENEAESNEEHKTKAEYTDFSFACAANDTETTAVMPNLPNEKVMSEVEQKVNCGTSQNNGICKVDIGSSEANRNLNSCTQKFPQNILDGRFIQSFEISPKGGKCFLPQMGVYLVIPSGAVEKPTKIFIGLSKNGHDIPDGRDGGHLYSPVIICGPHGFKFNKTAYLVFQHSLIFPSASKFQTPILYQSETSLIADTKWLPFQGKVFVTRKFVVAGIHGFTKYVWRSTSPDSRIQYRLLKVLVALEQEHKVFKDSMAKVQVYVVDAEDSEEKNVEEREQKNGGTIVARETFLYHEESKTGISVTLSSSDAYTINNRSLKIMDHESILDNRIGLENHATFHLTRQKPHEVNTMDSLDCDVKVSQVNGMEKCVKVVRNIVNIACRNSQRDSGFQEPTSAPGLLRHKHPCAVTPRTSRDSQCYPEVSTQQSHQGESNSQNGRDDEAGALTGARETSNVDSKNVEESVLNIAKPGKTQDFILDPKLRSDLEVNMTTELVQSLARHLQVCRPEEWDATGVLYLYEAMRSDRNEALAELKKFFQEQGEEKLAKMCL